MALGANVACYGVKFIDIARKRLEPLRAAACQAVAAGDRDVAAAVAGTKLAALAAPANCATAPALKEEEALARRAGAGRSGGRGLALRDPLGQQWLQAEGSAGELGPTVAARQRRRVPLPMYNPPNGHGAHESWCADNKGHTTATNYMNGSGRAHQIDTHQLVCLERDRGTKCEVSTRRSAAALHEKAEGKATGHSMHSPAAAHQRRSCAPYARAPSTQAEPAEACKQREQRRPAAGPAENCRAVTAADSAAAGIATATAVTVADLGQALELDCWQMRCRRLVLRVRAITEVDATHCMVTLAPISTLMIVHAAAAQADNHE
jgi:hypothetical protein